MTYRILFLFSVCFISSVFGEGRHRKDLLELSEQLGKGSPFPGAMSPEEIQRRLSEAQGGRSIPPQKAFTTFSQCQSEMKFINQVPLDKNPQYAGRGLYFLRSIDGISQLYFKRTPRSNAIKLSNFSWGVQHFQIDPAGKQILVTHYSENRKQNHLSLYIPDRRIWHPIIKSPKESVDSLHWSPSGHWAAYTVSENKAVFSRLYKFTSKNRQSTLVKRLGRRHTLSDISPDNKRMALVAWESDARSSLFIWDQNRLMKVPKSRNHTLQMHGRFSSDSNGLFFLESRGGRWQQLHYLALIPGSQPLKLTQFNWDVEWIATSRKRKSLIYGLNAAGFTHMKGFQKNRSGKWLEKKRFPRLSRSVLEPPHFKKGGREFFFSVSSPGQPHSIWEWTGTQLVNWSGPHKTKGRKCLPKPHLVVFPSFDKILIPAYLYYPPQIKGKAAFAIYAHDFDKPQSRPEYKTHIQHLLQRGIGVLDVNYRGSHGYDQSYQAMDDYANRLKASRDLAYGAKWLVKVGWADPNRIAVYGEGYGGFLALNALSQYGELFRAGSQANAIFRLDQYIEGTSALRQLELISEFGFTTDTSFYRSLVPNMKFSAPLLSLITKKRARDIASQKALSKRKNASDFTKSYLAKGKLLENTATVVDLGKFLEAKTRKSP